MMEMHEPRDQKIVINRHLRRSLVVMNAEEEAKQKSRRGSFADNPSLQIPSLNFNSVKTRHTKAYAYLIFYVD